MKKAYILVKDEEQKQKVLDTIFKHPDTLDLAIEVVIDTPENREAIEKLADEEYKIQTTELIEDIKKPHIPMDYEFLYPVSHKPFYLHYDKFKHKK